jgi:hypothetical protein
MFSTRSEREKKALRLTDPPCRPNRVEEVRKAEVYEGRHFGTFRDSLVAPDLESAET